MCQARTVLTEDDWQIVGFYRRVSDQVVELGGTFVPRLEGYRAALELWSYPPEQHSSLIESATLLHRLFYKYETVEWLRETGKSLRDIQPEDVTDGD